MIYILLGIITAVIIWGIYQAFFQTTDYIITIRCKSCNQHIWTATDEMFAILNESRVCPKCGEAKGYYSEVGRYVKGKWEEKNTE